MKLVTTATLTVLNVEKKEASGQYGESYKVAIMQGAEVGTYSCTKEVYEAVKDALMKPYNVQFTHNDYNGETKGRITAVGAPQK